jgi:hypothetical protein
MEFLAGLFIGMTGWFIFGGLLLAALVVEHKECHGWTLFLGACALIGGKLLFGLSWDVIGYALLAYLPIGFIWSFWRWRKRCAKLVQYFERDDWRWDLSTMKNKVDVKNNIGLIVMWIFVWPFSMS